MQKKTILHYSSAHKIRTLVTLVYMVALLLAPKIISDNVHIHFNPLMIVGAVFIMVSCYVMFKSRLVLDEQGIFVRHPLISALNWELKWSEIQDCMLIRAPLGMPRVLFRTKEEDKEILLKSWSTQQSGGYSFSNSDAKESALYKQLEALNIIPREASKEESNKIMRERLVLSREASVLSVLALGFAVIAFLLDINFNKFKVMDYGYINYIVFIVTFIALFWGLRYSKSVRLFQARVIILLIFSACTFWVLRSVSVALIYQTGSHESVSYYLKKTDEDSQTWAAEKNNYPDYIVFFDPKNNKISTIGHKEELEIIKGFLGVYLSPKDNARKFLIKAQGWPFLP